MISEYNVYRNIEGDPNYASYDSSGENNVDISKRVVVGWGLSSQEVSKIFDAIRGMSVEKADKLITMSSELKCEGKSNLLEVINEFDGEIV
jgi:hypothetical protein